MGTWGKPSGAARERARALARTSESLRRSEARYAAPVNLAHEGIAATDESFCLDFVNPRMAQMLGAPAARLVVRLTPSGRRREASRGNRSPPACAAGSVAAMKSN
jgi:PAS domain-containing protein